MSTYLVVLLLDARTSAMLLGPLNAASIAWLDHHYEALDALMRLCGLPIGYVEQPDELDSQDVVTLTVTEWLTGSLKTVERLLDHCQTQGASPDVEARSQGVASRLDVLENLQVAERKLATALQDYTLLETF